MGQGARCTRARSDSAVARVGEHPRGRGARPGAGGAGPGGQVRVLLVRRGREAPLPDAARVFQQRRQCFLGGSAVQVLVHLVGDGPRHRADYHVPRGWSQEGAAAEQPGETGPRPRHLARRPAQPRGPPAARRGRRDCSAPARQKKGGPRASDRCRIPWREPPNLPGLRHTFTGNLGFPEGTGVAPAACPVSADRTFRPTFGTRFFGSSPSRSPPLRRHKNAAELSAGREERTKARLERGAQQASCLFSTRSEA